MRIGWAGVVLAGCSVAVDSEPLEPGDTADSSPVISASDTATPHTAPILIEVDETQACTPGAPLLDVVLGVPTGRSCSEGCASWEYCRDYSCEAQCGDGCAVCFVNSSGYESGDTAVESHAFGNPTWEPEYCSATANPIPDEVGGLTPWEVVTGHDAIDDTAANRSTASLLDADGMPTTWFSYNPPAGWTVQDVRFLGETLLVEAIRAPNDGASGAKLCDMEIRTDYDYRGPIAVYEGEDHAMLHHKIAKDFNYDRYSVTRAGERVFHYDGETETTYTATRLP